MRRLIGACTSYGVFVWRRGDEARGTIGALYSRTVRELDKARLKDFLPRYPLIAYAY